AGRSAGWRSARMGDLRARRTGGVFGTDVEPPGAILIRGGRIESVMTEAEARVLQSDFPYLDAGGRAVIPGFVDAHTHLVFAGDRADEYAARLEGRPYEAGGIMRTVERTRAAGVDELINGVVGRAEACLDLGTTTIDQARRVQAAGRKHGLAPHIHADQLTHSGGARLAAEMKCASADHLVHVTADDARAMAAAGVVAVLLPSASFCMQAAYAPA